MEFWVFFIWFLIGKNKTDIIIQQYKKIGATPVPISNTEVKSKASMILGWRRPGKVDSARINLKGIIIIKNYESFFFCID